MGYEDTCRLNSIMSGVGLKLVLVCTWLSPAAACSSYAAGRLATTDGSVMVSHSQDGAGATDPRLTFVPAADHPPGSQRNIWPTIDDENWPRFVGSGRGSIYAPLPGQNLTEPLGTIPQVAHTLAFYDSAYAVQNECHLMFGESTASATFPAVALGEPGGTALFNINELTRVAAERVCSAREAVKLMGALAEAYGFYGPDGGAGEVLMVGDVEEVFVFNILSDPTGKSAIWAAQRVADDHVAVVANMFSIREIDASDEHTFLYSGSAHAVALETGLWDGHAPLDFTGAFSSGEYGSKYYTGRRVWDGYRRMKPSLSLPPEYGSLKHDRPYPFSVPLAEGEKLSVQAWFAAHRSHYEGTAYDMTRGLAAGPFGTPDRYAASSSSSGAWERSVAIYRTAFTWVIQASAGLPEHARGTVWWALADSATDCH